MRFGLLTTEDTAQWTRIEQLVKDLKRATEKYEMARKETDAKLIDEIHRNTKEVHDLIAQFSASVADLTAKLADAIANSDAADDDEVQAVLVELKETNDELAAKLAPPA
jgi:septal ring factor EnvC (AmiA/AmiB activator)